MNIPEALKNEASKLQRQLNSVHASHQSLRRKERGRMRQETACLRERKGQDVQGTEGAVGKGESH